MDDELPLLPGPPEPEEPADPEGAPLPELPPEITSGDDELRRLIAAGASTPEELRDLAARIREHRELEETVWRNEMRPALKKAKKSPFRLGDILERPADIPTSNGIFYGFIIVGLAVVLVLAATQSSIIWVLLPLVGVLGYAYWQGRQGESVDDAPPAPEDAPD